MFTIHEPPDAPADRLDRAESLVFLQDGFSWGAAILGPFWIAARGEWAALVAYAAGVIVLAGLFKFIGASPGWMTLAILALNVTLGFEASSLCRWSLDRAGWLEIGTVSGRNGAECERRFFESWLPGLPGHPANAARERGVPAGSLTESAGAAARVRPRPQGWRSLFDAGP